ncbi:hypothetical protein [Piscinibacter sp. XHJ-5]|uniref:hypothetical protein n=1 Tax=Piscinibacter sp. XHJ-5 TaxID=3037797 RepID=UPI002452991E|nr:hypothetical protein [Piscinibacter sp. XHJ-5]
MPVIEVDFRRQRAGEGPDDDDWPTTQRFSRRSGEKMRGADYAAAIERPRHSALPAWPVAIGVVVAILGAVASVLWHAE